MTAIMNSNGTETVYDDEFVMIQYAGYMEGWEMMLYLEAME